MIPRGIGADPERADRHVEAGAVVRALKRYEEESSADVDEVSEALSSYSH